MEIMKAFSLMPRVANGMNATLTIRADTETPNESYIPMMDWCITPMITIRHLNSIIKQQKKRTGKMRDRLSFSFTDMQFYGKLIFTGKSDNGPSTAVIFCLSR